VPHLNIGQKVMVARSPYREDAILLIEQDEHRRDVHWVCPKVAFDAAGFRDDAPVWGQDYKALPETPAVQDMKAIERLAYGVDGKLAVDAARRKRAPVFGGLDITSHLDAATPASYMVRPGTEMEIATPVTTGRTDGLSLPGSKAVEARRLNCVQLAGLLAAELAGEWNAGCYQRLTAWYPEGALESDLPEIIERFKGVPRLKAVGAN